MTRLRDLEPDWIARRGRIVGIRFLCPVNDGAGPHHEGHSICVLFVNPPDGGAAHPPDDTIPGNNDGLRWTMSGTTFDDLTLHPSVDCTQAGRCDKPDHSACSHSHCWHGVIERGVASP